MPQLAVLDRVERAESLDRVVLPVKKVVGTVLRSATVRDALHGVWLGHPVHPLLVQVPIGAWLSAGVLDVVPGAGRASTVLVGLGLGAAGPAAVAGWADWSQLHEQQMRVGLVHATSNAAAVGLYAGSLSARLRGRGVRGRLLGWAGLATAALGGFVGGHLAYRQAAGPNHAEGVPHVLPPGWHPVGELSDLPEGAPTERAVAGVPVTLVRRGGTVHALAGRCSHLDGPLTQGEVGVDGQGEPCLTCPWHGSTFRLRDGAVVRGPATAPQPSLRTRVVDGALEVMLEGAG